MLKINVDFGGERTVVPDPLPPAYSLYAFINVDNCERPLIAIVVAAFVVADNYIFHVCRNY